MKSKRTIERVGKREYKDPAERTKVAVALSLSESGTIVVIVVLVIVD
jgi:hypothetical protein